MISPQRHGASDLSSRTHARFSICAWLEQQVTYKRQLQAICSAAVHVERQ